MEANHCESHGFEKTHEDKWRRTIVKTMALKRQTKTGLCQNKSFAKTNEDTWRQTYCKTIALRTQTQTHLCRHKIFEKTSGDTHKRTYCKAKVWRRQTKTNLRQSMAWISEDEGSCLRRPGGLAHVSRGLPFGPNSQLLKHST